MDRQTDYEREWKANRQGRLYFDTKLLWDYVMILLEY